MKPSLIELILICIVILVGGAMTLFYFKRRITLLTLGEKSNRLNNYKTRAWIFIKRVLFQTHLFERPITGLMHALVFWGFCAFMLATMNHVFEGFFGIENSIFFGLPIGHYYFAFVDIMALLTSLAVLGLCFRRYVLKPEALTPKSVESGIVIAFIFFLMVTFFLSSAFKFGIGAKLTPTLDFPEQNMMLISGAFAKMFSGLSETALIVGYKINWWLHLLLLVGFSMYVPNSKHMHLAACPVNEFLLDLETRGVQEKMSIFEDDGEDESDDDDEEMPSFGKNRIEQFPWNDLLDLYACVECGRCQDACPAYQSGKELNPKYIILDMKEHFLANASKLLKAKKEGKDMTEVEREALVGSVISNKRLWDCTTCYACQEMCPVGNEHPQKILEMRRYLAMDAEESLPETSTLYRNLENQSNPWGLARSERGDFLKEFGVKTVEEAEEYEYILWLGCSGAYDQRAQKTIIALVKLLQIAGISFAILGEMEGCCGDAARRLGNEEMFFSLASENIETMKEIGAKKIITTCPHGFHTMKFEYPQYGGNFDVEHYATLLARLISEGKLKISNKFDKKVCFHDSCYLGRYHSIYDEPRAILQASGVNLVEMSNSKHTSFCCGGGGGRMFLEENDGKRINQLRTDQAKDTGGEVVAVSCPFCLTMIEDGIKELGYEESMKTNDLAEILLHAVEGKE